MAKKKNKSPKFRVASASELKTKMDKSIEELETEIKRLEELCENDPENRWIKSKLILTQMHNWISIYTGNYMFYQMIFSNKEWKTIGESLIDIGNNAIKAGELLTMELFSDEERAEIDKAYKEEKLSKLN